MVLAPSVLSETIAALHTAPLGHWAAGPIPRAAGLPPLPSRDTAEVAEKLEKIKGDIPISPVLLMGETRDYPLVRDGHHRASAVYQVDVDALVPGRLLWSSRAPRPRTGKRGPM